MPLENGSPWPSSRGHPDNRIPYVRDFRNERDRNIEKITSKRNWGDRLSFPKPAALLGPNITETSNKRRIPDLSRSIYSNDTAQYALSIHPLDTPASVMARKLPTENELLSRKYDHETHFSPVFTTQSSFSKPNSSIEPRMKEKIIRSQNPITDFPAKPTEVKENNSALEFTVNPSFSSNSLTVADSVWENDKTVLSKEAATWDSTFREREKGRYKANYSYHRPISSFSPSINSEFEHDWSSSSSSSSSSSTVVTAATASTVVKEGEMNKLDAYGKESNLKEELWSAEAMNKETNRNWRLGVRERTNALASSSTLSSPSVKERQESITVAKTSADVDLSGALWGFEKSDPVSVQGFKNDVDSILPDLLPSPLSSTLARKPKMFDEQEDKELPLSSSSPPPKRLRLGWGQGLAKYEKKRIEGDEVSSEINHKNEDKNQFISNMKNRSPSAIESAITFPPSSLSSPSSLPSDSFPISSPALPFKSPPAMDFSVVKEKEGSNGGNVNASVDIASSFNHVSDKFSSLPSSSTKIQSPSPSPSSKPLPLLLSSSRVFPSFNKEDEKIACSPSSNDPWIPSSTIAMHPSDGLNSSNLIHLEKNHPPLPLSDVSLLEKDKSVDATLATNGDAYDLVNTEKGEGLNTDKTREETSENIQIVTKNAENVSELDLFSDFQVKMVQEKSQNIDCDISIKNKNDSTDIEKINQMKDDDVIDVEKNGGMEKDMNKTSDVHSLPPSPSIPPNVKIYQKKEKEEIPKCKESENDQKESNIISNEKSKSKSTSISMASDRPHSPPSKPITAKNSENSIDFDTNQFEFDANSESKSNSKSNSHQIKSNFGQTDTVKSSLPSQSSQKDVKVNDQKLSNSNDTETTIPSTITHSHDLEPNTVLSPMINFSTAVDVHLQPHEEKEKKHKKKDIVSKEKDEVKDEDEDKHKDKGKGVVAFERDLSVDTSDAIADSEEDFSKYCKDDIVNKIEEFDSIAQKIKFEINECDRIIVSLQHDMNAKVNGKSKSTNMSTPLSSSGRKITSTSTLSKKNIQANEIMEMNEMEKNDECVMDVEKRSKRENEENDHVVIFSDEDGEEDAVDVEMEKKMSTISKEKESFLLKSPLKFIDHSSPLLLQKKRCIDSSHSSKRMKVSNSEDKSFIVFSFTECDKPELNVEDDNGNDYEKNNDDGDEENGNDDVHVKRKESDAMDLKSGSRLNQKVRDQVKVNRKGGRGQKSNKGKGKESETVPNQNQTLTTDKRLIIHPMFADSAKKYLASSSKVNGQDYFMRSIIQNTHDHPILTLIEENRMKAQSASDTFNSLIYKNDSAFNTKLYSYPQQSPFWKVNEFEFKQNASILQSKLYDDKHTNVMLERVLAIKYRVLRESWRRKQNSNLNLNSNLTVGYSRRERLSMEKSASKSSMKLSSSFSYQSQGQSQSQRSSHRLQGSVEDAKGEELSLAKILLSKPITEPRVILRMPPMILDEKEKKAKTFISSNALILDPVAVEEERKRINPWTEEEKQIFLDKFLLHNKDFSAIAKFLTHKTVADCVEFYYRNQKSEEFESMRKKNALRKRREGKNVSYLATNHHSPSPRIRGEGSSGGRFGRERGGDPSSFLPSPSPSPSPELSGNRRRISMENNAKYFRSNSQRSASERAKSNAAIIPPFLPSPSPYPSPSLSPFGVSPIERSSSRNSFSANGVELTTSAAKDKPSSGSPHLRSSENGNNATSARMNQSNHLKSSEVKLDPSSNGIESSRRGRKSSNSNSNSIIKGAENDKRLRRRNEATITIEREKRISTVKNLHQKNNVDVSETVTEPVSRHVSIPEAEVWNNAEKKEVSKSGKKNKESKTAIESINESKGKAIRMMNSLNESSSKFPSTVMSVEEKQSFDFASVENASSIQNNPNSNSNVLLNRMKKDPVDLTSFLLPPSSPEALPSAMDSTTVLLEEEKVKHDGDKSQACEKEMEGGKDKNVEGRETVEGQVCDEGKEEKEKRTYDSKGGKNDSVDVDVSEKKLKLTLKMQSTKELTLNDNIEKEVCVNFVSGAEVLCSLKSSGEEGKTNKEKEKEGEKGEKRKLDKEGLEMMSAKDMVGKKGGDDVNDDNDSKVMDDTTLSHSQQNQMNINYHDQSQGLEKSISMPIEIANDRIGKKNKFAFDPSSMAVEEELRVEEKDDVHHKKKSRVEESEKEKEIILKKDVIGRGKGDNENGEGEGEDNSIPSLDLFAASALVGISSSSNFSPPLPLSLPPLIVQRVKAEAMDGSAPLRKGDAEGEDEKMKTKVKEMDISSPLSFPLSLLASQIDLLSSSIAIDSVSNDCNNSQSVLGCNRINDVENCKLKMEEKEKEKEKDGNVYGGSNVAELSEGMEFEKVVKRKKGRSKRRERTDLGNIFFPSLDNVNKNQNEGIKNSKTNSEAVKSNKEKVISSEKEQKTAVDNDIKFERRILRNDSKKDKNESNHLDESKRIDASKKGDMGRERKSKEKEKERGRNASPLEGIKQRKEPTTWTMVEKESFAKIIESNGKDWMMLKESIPNKSLAQIKTYYQNSKSRLSFLIPSNSNSNLNAFSPSPSSSFAIPSSSRSSKKRKTDAKDEENAIINGWNATKSAKSRSVRESGTSIAKSMIEKHSSDASPDPGPPAPSPSPAIVNTTLDVPKSSPLSQPSPAIEKSFHEHPLQDHPSSLSPSPSLPQSLAELFMKNVHSKDMKEMEKKDANNINKNYNNFNIQMNNNNNNNDGNNHGNNVDNAASYNAAVADFQMQNYMQWMRQNDMSASLASSSQINNSVSAIENKNEMKYYHPFYHSPSASVFPFLPPVNFNSSLLHNLQNAESFPPSSPSPSPFFSPNFHKSPFDHPHPSTTLPLFTQAIPHTPFPSTSMNSSQKTNSSENSPEKKLKTKSNSTPLLHGLTDVKLFGQSLLQQPPFSKPSSSPSPSSSPPVDPSLPFSSSSLPPSSLSMSSSSYFSSTPSLSNSAKDAFKLSTVSPISFFSSPFEKMDDNANSLLLHSISSHPSSADARKDESHSHSHSISQWKEASDGLKRNAEERDAVSFLKSESSSSSAVASSSPLPPSLLHPSPFLSKRTFSSDDASSQKITKDESHTTVDVKIIERLVRNGMVAMNGGKESWIQGQGRMFHENVSSFSSPSPSSPSGVYNAASRGDASMSAFYDSILSLSQNQVPKHPFNGFPSSFSTSISNKVDENYGDGGKKSFSWEGMDNDLKKVEFNVMDESYGVKKQKERGEEELNLNQEKESADELHSKKNLPVWLLKLWKEKELTEKEYSKASMSVIPSSSPSTHSLPRPPFNADAKKREEEKERI